MTLLEPHNLPFAGAALLLVFIALAQVIGMGDLFESADADIDLDADIDGIDAVDGPSGVGFVEGMFGLMGLGRVPFLIWLTTLLFVFAAFGVLGQQLMIAVTGAPAGAWIAAVGAAIFAVPANGVLTRPLERLLPQDETSAVGLDSLIRRDAEIQIGTATAGSPARAKVMDRFGHPHFVMVEPHDAKAQLIEGETVLLTRREGNTFFAIQYENPLLGLD